VVVETPDAETMEAVKKHSATTLAERLAANYLQTFTRARPR
jgi:hypothetical protein